ncbi:hypothetical protein ACYATO_08790 [Lactobacillaceae bacterium Melli_B3]
MTHQPFFASFSWGEKEVRDPGFELNPGGFAYFAIQSKALFGSFWAQKGRFRTLESRLIMMR